MKKSLISFRQMDTYKHYFLPLLEVILTLKTWKSQDLVINQETLASYFELDRRIISDFLKQAELDGLIIFDKKVRKVDDKTLTHAMRRYILPSANNDSKFYSKLQEYINTYMDWTPDFGDRLDFYYDYMKSIETDESVKSIKQLQKEEKAKQYAVIYSWVQPLMEKINFTRPDLLKSKYLSDGKLRESNRLCATLNPEKDHEAKLFAQDIGYRYILLEEFFGTKDFIECDTNASIYRLCYNLNHDKLLDDHVDIYAQFWKLAGFKTELDFVTRDSLKLLCMIIFMSNGSKNGYNSTLAVKDYQDLTKSEQHRKDVLNHMSRRTGLTPRQFLDKLTEAMYEFLGVDHFMEEEIFIHESNLHLLILEICEQEHIKAINVYDGFYFRKKDMTAAKYNMMYREATLRLKELENIRNSKNT